VDLATLDVEQAAEIAAEYGAAAADDADQVAGDPAREAALLHLYNLIRAAKGHLLLTACAAPSRWGLALPDLESRLNGALSAAIDPPEDELLAAVAVKLFADRQIAIAEEVIPLLVNRAERSLAGIGRAVEALDLVALATGRPITLALARSVLADLTPG
jgi:chromosomal replication initiation ATPase DnaA